MADLEKSDTDARISIPDQLAYWAQISADDNGMLGGYPQISRIDIQFSRTFLRKLQRMYPDKSQERGATTTTTTKYAFRHCLETGAGIGRVTFNLLSSMCEKIDVIEPIEKFTAMLTAKDSPLVKAGQLRRVWNVPLQEWTADSVPSYEYCGDERGVDMDADADVDVGRDHHPNPSEEQQQQQQQQIGSTVKANANANTRGKSHDAEREENRQGEQGGRRYDLIYNQWCLNHLTFASLVRFFRSLIPLLAKGGWIIVKENLSTEASGADTFWEEDSSVARSDRNWRASFERAGLKVVWTQLQTGFPKSLGLLPVRMYALRPLEGRGLKGP